MLAAQAQVHQRLLLRPVQLAEALAQQQQPLLDLCLRREQLRVAERARLFGAAAGYVQERLGLAPEAFESDEKFVQRLTAILGG